MTHQEIITKSKDFSLAMIDVQSKATKEIIEAFNSFAGKEFATYTYGVTSLANQVTDNARKIVENFTSLAHAGNKK